MNEKQENNRRKREAIERFRHIISDLKADAETANSKASWRNMFESCLDTDLEGEEFKRHMTRALQMRRDALGTADAEADFRRSLITLAEEITFDRDNDAELVRISNEMRAIEEREGLEDGEFWMLGEGPDDFILLDEEYERRMHEIQADVFRQYGEDEMADAILKGDNSFRELMKLPYDEKIAENLKKRDEAREAARERLGIRGLDK